MPTGGAVRRDLFLVVPSALVPSALRLSIPENTQRPVTLEELANMAGPMQGTPVSRDPATPSYHPFEAQEQEIVTAEIDLSNEHAEKEQGGTAATDLKLAAEQVAMQGLHNYQVAALGDVIPTS